jgi:hypothetical protein
MIGTLYTFNQFNNSLLLGVLYKQIRRCYFILSELIASPISIIGCVAINENLAPHLRGAQIAAIAA